MSWVRTVLAGLVLAGICRIADAQMTNSTISTGDAFLATGSPGNPDGNNLTNLNYGGAGALVVAPPSSNKGEFQSVLKFNLSDVVGAFNTNYGANGWIVSGMTLKLTGNFGGAGEQPFNPIFPAVSGGQFVIEWLSNDNWAEGTGNPNLPTMDGVTYDSLPGLLSEPHAILSTNTYVPPGDNVPAVYTLPLNTSLVADVVAGGDVTLLLRAADGQIAYLFNSHDYGRGNEPVLQVAASPVGPTIVAGFFTNGVFHINARGIPNAQYQVQASVDLGGTNWLSVGTSTADSTGLMQFDDTGGSGGIRKFYRLSH